MNELHFDGRTFNPKLDAKRLTTQFDRVHALMRDGQWRTLAEIVEAVSYPPYERATEASVSARLRDFRKARHGSMTVERRRREGATGLFEYRVKP